MHTILILVVFVFHIVAARPFLRAIRTGRIPGAIDFACVSFLLYYDMGLALELLGYSLHDPLYTSLLSIDTDTFLAAVVLLLAAPWALRTGNWIVNKGRTYEPASLGLQMGRMQLRYFYVLTVALVLPVTAFGVLHVHDSQSLWSVRYTVGSQLGVFVMVLYIPVSILCFYLCLAESRTRRGNVIMLALILASVAAPLPIGERSLVLVPFLVVALFRLRISVLRLLAYGVALLVAASLMLTVFKWQYSGTSGGPDTLVADTISSDVARAPTLGAAIHMSVPIGTRVAPYPFAGYVYSLMLFVPRQIAPFKGTSTQQDFTAYLVGGSPDATDWGLGVGAVEEILVNGGFILVLPILILYGMGLGYLDRLSVRAPVISAPARLAGLWICAYHLPALLQLYGFMALVGVALQWWFRDKSRPVALPSPIDAKTPVHALPRFSRGRLRSPAAVRRREDIGVGARRVREGNA